MSEKTSRFISMIAPIAQREMEKRKKAGRKWILPSICIAQAACESAWGTSKKMRKANALFGIKVGRNKVRFGTAWKGKAYSTRTSECYDGKNYVKIADMFRAYDSVKEAVEDYFDMLTSCSRYTLACNVSDAEACIKAIKKGGYATSPTYVNTIMSIVRSHDLTKFDRDTEHIPEEPLAKKYQIGKVYTLTSNLYVRYKAGGDKKPIEKLTRDGRRHAYKDAEGFAIMKKGTRVTCKRVSVLEKGSVWIDIPSGSICAMTSSGKEYIK